MSVVPIPANKDEWGEKSIVFATEEGMIRRTPLEAFANIRANGIHGIGLNAGDRLIDAKVCDTGQADVLISSAKGQAVRFNIDKNLRPIASRTAKGVKGMKLRKGDKVMSMRVLVGDGTTHILSVTAKGFGKLTPVEDYPVKGRGTMGVISIKTTSRNGDVVAVLPVAQEDQVMIGTSDGQIIRTKVEGISIMGRNTQGVRLFNVGTKSHVSLVTRISSDMLEEKENDAADQPLTDDATPDMIEAVEKAPDEAEQTT
jgi:DNA gyrase subunit A